MVAILASSLQEYIEGSYTSQQFTRIYRGYLYQLVVYKNIQRVSIQASSLQEYIEGLATSKEDTVKEKEEFPGKASRITNSKNDF